MAIIITIITIIASGDIPILLASAPLRVALAID